MKNEQTIVCSQCLEELPAERFRFYFAADGSPTRHRQPCRFCMTANESRSRESKANRKFNELVSWPPPEIERHGTGILVSLLVLLILSGCSSIAEHQRTATKYEPPTGTVTRQFSVFYLPPEEVHFICAPSEACERSGDIFMEARGEWQGVDDYVLTWDFSGELVEMDGVEIRGRAWPAADELGELLAVNLELPPSCFRYHRILAHEVMHVFGMEHPGR